MPDSAVSQTSPPIPNPGTSAPPTSGPDRATDGRFEPREWRYPADYHISYLRGKTADEAAQLNQQMYEVLQSQQPQQQQYAPQPQYQQQPQALSEPTNEEWLNDTQGASRKFAQHIRATQFEPVLNQYAQTIGSQARALCEMRDADAFRRWGPEIDTYIARYMPNPAQRTVESIGAVIDLVRGKHVNELIAEREREVLSKAQTTNTMRSDAGGIAAGASDGNRIDFNNTGLPEEYRRALERYRVTPETLDEFLTNTECRKRGISLQQARDEWLKAAKSGDIITEETRGNNIRIVSEAR